LSCYVKLFFISEVGELPRPKSRRRRGRDGGGRRRMRTIKRPGDENTSSQEGHGISIVNVVEMKIRTQSVKGRPEGHDF
jgi:hypothetical protein